MGESNGKDEGCDDGEYRIERDRMTHGFEYDKSSIPEIYAVSRELPVETIDLWLNAIEDSITTSVETILDLGCGEGRFSVPLAIRFSARVCGVDPSKKMLSIARERDRTMNEVQYLLGNGEHIPLDDKRVSMVFMSMVYHHLDDGARTVSETKRVLKPDGHVAVRNATQEDINQNDTFNFFPAAKQLELQRMPKEEEIIAAFEAEGLGLVSCRTLNQVFAQNHQDHYNKISKRGLSALALISDSDFETGLKKLKQYCERKSQDAKVYERFHLFMFRKS